MMRGPGPSASPALGAGRLLLAALYGGQFQMVLVLVASIPALPARARRPRRENVSWGMAVTILGIVWIGFAVAHAVLLRELPHGGGLVLDVLIGTFVGDTCRLLRRARLGPPAARAPDLAEQDGGGPDRRDRRRHIRLLAVPVAYQHDCSCPDPRADHRLLVAAGGAVGDLFESLHQARPGREGQRPGLRGAWRGAGSLRRVVFHVVTAITW